MAGMVASCQPEIRKHRDTRTVSAVAIAARPRTQFTQGMALAVNTVPEPDSESSRQTAANAISTHTRNSMPMMRYGQRIATWLEYRPAIASLSMGAANVWLQRQASQTSAMMTFNPSRTHLFM